MHFTNNLKLYVIIKNSLYFILPQKDLQFWEIHLRFTLHFRTQTKDELYTKTLERVLKVETKVVDVRIL